MALSKVNFNSLNVTPAASKAIKFNSSNNGIETGDVGGSLVLISTETASSSGTIQFTSGIDSTYKEYIIKIINCHAETNNVRFLFNMSADGGSNYNVTKTTTIFESRHDEDGSNGGVAYSGRTLSEDLAQSTSFQKLCFGVSNDNDHAINGYIHLFDPSNTTFVKHYIGLISNVNETNGAYQYYNAGYANTTSAINAVQFKMDSDNIDAGTFKLYGVV